MGPTGEFERTIREIQGKMRELNLSWFGKAEAEAYSAVLVAGLANEARLLKKSLPDYMASLGLGFVYRPEMGKAGMEGAAGRGQNFAQAVNPDVDMNAEVDVVDIDLGQYIDAQLSTPQDLLAYIKGFVEKNAILTADSKAALEISTNNQARHLVRSSRKGLTYEEMDARSAALRSIDDVIKHAVLIESFPNQDPAKESVKNVHRIYVPLRVGNTSYLLRLVGHEMKDKGKFATLHADLLNLIIENKNPSRPQSALFSESSAPAERSNITIREMLRGVKDAEGQPYVFEQSSWQGSPYKGIEKMSLEKIGTGEGAQAYGWGLYSAQAKKLAEWYRKTITDRKRKNADNTILVNSDEYHRVYTDYYKNGKRMEDVRSSEYRAINVLIGAGGDRQKAFSSLSSIAELHQKNADRGGEAANYYEQEAQSFMEAIAFLNGAEIQTREVPDTGQLYRLEVPESGELLDWDKPLSEQPKKIQEIINKTREEYGMGGSDASTGEDIYKELVFQGKMEGAENPQKWASKKLNSLGIPGLQYLDGSSRAGGEDTHNFVIWDEDRMSVEESYYQFAGEEAETADRLRLNEAQKMAEAGNDNETIWQKTGWFKSIDEKWRFEIPDNLDGINLGVDWTNDVTLGQLYDNEALYRAYPEMKETQVFLMESRGWEGALASYSVRANEIALYGITEQTKRALVHEIQHVIQHIEGFAKGGTIGNAYPADGKSGAWDMLEKNRQSMLTPMSLEEYAEYTGYENLQDAEFSYGEYLEEHENRFKEGIPADLDLDLQKNTAWHYYENLAGEIEARDAARRTWLSEDERRDTPPDLPDGAIIVFGGEEVGSYSVRENRLTHGERLYRDERAWEEAVGNLRASDAPAGQHIKVMTTPLAFHLAGAKVLPVYMDDAKLFEILKNHPGMTWDLIKQIPGALADPIAVFSSKRVPNGLVAMLELEDKNGATVVGALHLNVQQDSGRYVVNRLASVYGKSDISAVPPTPKNKWFTEELTSERLRYLNTKKSSRWLGQTGLQLPAGTTIESLIQSVPTETDLVKLRETYDGYYQKEQRVVKAAAIFGDGQTIIELFQAADRSSFLHEMGHLFLESRRRISLIDDIPQQVKDDWKTVTDWLNMSDLDFSKPFRGSDADRWRTAQEKWAAGFEQYLMEGNAPSPGLARAFEDFKEWLTDIYRAAKNVLFVDARGESHSVGISDEIRQVMGRILRDEKDLVRYDPVPEYSSPPENGSEHRNETSEEFELQVGQKVLFRLDGSGTALNGNVIRFDEAEVRIRTGEREMTLRRDMGSFEILPGGIKIREEPITSVSRERTEPAEISR